ncbi:type 2 isopentenyl-diphosphate Delta-isomerase [Vagococcus luciliae]|uniref:Isopentenyl-diphosphate delta-isomerase n=1 Tax=Vagococcus luciliae TaxID=2920380 RepID=A0ABY5P1M3_9ENTE|nr:type 2 isopentenyl-diphosphate Delta-isomerase [Vagococcus luciliae]UUV99829.1 Isopentenyl-diphosphate delta-isomerase [Vagococcus luciliae]
MTTSWNRKDQHIHYAEMQYSQPKSNGLDGVRFVHQSFSEISVKDVSLHTNLDTLKLAVPFFINAMTGGSDKAAIINKNLAYVARETNIAMAVGSISIALNDTTQQESFKIVRKTNPNGVIFANLGAHHSVENAKRAVDLIEANALQLHLNTPQELVMPEGDRDFSSWLKNIESIVNNLNVPVIVKEVGFGMSKETIQQLIDVGVTIIDVAGKGGTNFIEIENQRRELKEYSYLYDWGQTTAESLLEARKFSSQAAIVASGGIKTPLDMLKSFGLGAVSTGLSGEFLHLILTKGTDETIQQIERFKEELTHLMVLVGAKSIATIKDQPLVLDSQLTNWCYQRHLPIN